jgi:hypothetical protein
VWDGTAPDVLVYEGTVPVYVWLWSALVVTDSVTVWVWEPADVEEATVCVWLVAAASPASVVRTEIVPEDAPRLPTP